MSSLEATLSKLVALGDERLGKFDEKCEEHMAWLDAAVEQTRVNLRAKCVQTITIKTFWLHPLNLYDIAFLNRTRSMKLHCPPSTKKKPVGKAVQG
jgi:hypothetical protein